LGVVVESDPVVGATALVEAILGAVAGILSLVGATVRGSTLGGVSDAAGGPGAAVVEAERVGVNVVWPHAARNTRRAMLIRKRCWARTIATSVALQAWNVKRQSESERRQ
jgi:hypothetical protein